MLGADDVASLLHIDDCIDAVEDVFRRWAEGTASPPAVLGVHVEEGGFHLKAAALRSARHYFAAKVNGNFPPNPDRHGIPSIHGVIVVADADDGRPLAVLDSMKVTELRTAAATGVAARHLAREDAHVATLIGCGAQANSQARALASVLPLRRLWVSDRDAGRAARFAEQAAAELGVDVAPTADLRAALAESRVCVTCTTSTAPLLAPGDVAPGTLIAAVGADNPEKHEIHPELMAASTVVVDSLEQCLAIGDLHHAVDAAAMSAEDVHASLGAVVAGLAPGRSDPDEIIVFDSTGTGLQDVAVAPLAYERALERGGYLAVDLGGSTRGGVPLGGPA